MPVIGNRLTVVVDNSSLKGPTSVSDSLLAFVKDKLLAAVAEAQVVVVELLTMVVDKSSAAEPMYNIDNSLSEPMFDTEKPSAVRYNNQSDERFYQHPHL